MRIWILVCHGVIVWTQRVHLACLVWLEVVTFAFNTVPLAILLEVLCTPTSVAPLCLTHVRWVGSLAAPIGSWGLTRTELPLGCVCARALWHLWTGLVLLPLLQFSQMPLLILGSQAKIWFLTSTCPTRSVPLTVWLQSHWVGSVVTVVSRFATISLCKPASCCFRYSISASLSLMAPSHFLDQQGTINPPSDLIPLSPYPIWSVSHWGVFWGNLSPPRPVRAQLIDCHSPHC